MKDDQFPVSRCWFSESSSNPCFQVSPGIVPTNAFHLSLVRFGVLEPGGHPKLRGAGGRLVGGFVVPKTHRRIWTLPGSC